MTDIIDTGASASPELQSGFWRDALEALRYPARGKAPLFLLVMALCLTVKPVADRLLGSGLSTLLRAPLLALSGVLGLAALVLLPAFYIDIVKRTAAGGQGSPGWPGLSDPAALAGSALKAYTVLIWSFLPLLLYMLGLENGTAIPSLLLVAALFIISFLYLPMALLRLITTDKLWPCLLPSNVIDPVVRTFRSYWRLPLLMLAIGLFMTVSALLTRIPVIGPAIAVFCGLYLYACMMNALGRFYRLEQKRLNWQ
jgi:hypothetical protein